MRCWLLALALGEAGALRGRQLETGWQAAGEDADGNHNPEADPTHTGWKTVEGSDRGEGDKDMVEHTGWKANAKKQDEGPDTKTIVLATIGGVGGFALVAWIGARKYLGVEPKAHKFTGASSGPPKKNPAPGAGGPGRNVPNDGCRRWEVTLRREAGQSGSGMQIKKHNWKQPYVSVGKITPGELVAQWNAAHPVNAIRLDDRIVGVNGCGYGDPHMIVSELMKGGPARVLSMERPPPPPPGSRPPPAAGSRGPAAGIRPAPVGRTSPGEAEERAEAIAAVEALEAVAALEAADKAEQLEQQRFLDDDVCRLRGDDDASDVTGVSV